MNIRNIKRRYIVLISVIIGIIISSSYTKLNDSQRRKYDLYQRKVHDILKYNEKINVSISYSGHSPKNILKAKLYGLNFNITTYIGNNHNNVLTAENKKQIKNISEEMYKNLKLNFNEYRILTSLVTNVVIKNNNYDIINDKLNFLSDLSIPKIKGHSYGINQNGNVIIQFITNEKIDSISKEKVNNELLEILQLNNISIEEIIF